MKFMSRGSNPEMLSYSLSFFFWIFCSQVGTKAEGAPL